MQQYLTHTKRIAIVTFKKGECSVFLPIKKYTCHSSEAFNQNVHVH